MHLWKPFTPDAKLHSLSRTNNMLRVALASTATISLALLTGCGGDKAASAAMLPTVEVSVVQIQPVTDWNDFTGHFNAVESVQLRPRVSGYIDKVQFEEGSDVSQGQVLFVIDQHPYQLQLQSAEAELNRAAAELKLAQSEMARSKKLLAVHAVSQEEFEQRLSSQNQLESQYQVAQAAYKQAQLNMEYTKVVSPVAGRVSRAIVTRGNYVTSGDTVLTSIVSLDPIYVEFSSDEQRYQNYRQLLRSGALATSGDKQTPVFVGLESDDNFPYTGQLTFIDNAVNSATGAIAIRAQISNPDKHFTPGMLARVRLQGSTPYQAAVINDAAIGTDQGSQFVLVVDANNVVQRQTVTTGGRVGSERVVRTGLKGGEKIIVNGLLRVRPGATVDAQLAKDAQPSKDAQLAKAEPSAAENTVKN